MDDINTPEVQAKQDASYVTAARFLDVDLPGACLRSGQWLQSVSVKYQGDSVLLVCKVSRSAEGPLVAFIGGRDLPHACRKGYDQLRKGGLNWKPDEWALQKLTSER